MGGASCFILVLEASLEGKYGHVEAVTELLNGFLIP